MSEYEFYSGLVLDQALQAVLEFHQAMKLEIGNFKKPAFAQCDLRLALIREEFQELEEAVRKRDLPEAADALADITYVVLGAALAWGIDLSMVFRAVHIANMRKSNGRRRADGKILKPAGWKPPDIAKVLAKQVEIASL